MSRYRVWTLILALALIAIPATAEVYHVTLTNGTEIETARQPEQASWDPNMILFVTEVGNWVGFMKDEIQGIRAENPIEGYGMQINDNAIALGWSPNDLPEPGKPGDASDRLASIAERQLEMQERQQNYSINQFVQPEETQGIPSSFSGGYGSGAAPFAGLPLNQAPIEPQDRIPPQ
jgi:hypothetical protein